MASEMPVDIVDEKARPALNFDDLPTPLRVKRNSSASTGNIDDVPMPEEEAARVEVCRGNIDDAPIPEEEAVPKEEDKDARVEEEKSRVEAEPLCIRCGVHPTNQRKALHQRGLCCNHCPDHGPWCTMHKENTKPQDKQHGTNRKQKEKKCENGSEVNPESKPKRQKKSAEQSLVDVALRKAEQAYNEKIESERKEQKKRRVEDEKELAAIEKRFKKRHTTLLSAVSATSEKTCTRLLAKSMNNVATSRNETSSILGELPCAANGDQDTMQSAPADEQAPRVRRALLTGGRRSSVHEVLQKLELAHDNKQQGDCEHSETSVEKPTPSDPEDDSFMEQVELWLRQEEQVAEPAEAESEEQGVPTAIEESVQESNLTSESTSSMPQEAEPQAEQSGRGEAALLKVKLLYKKLVAWKQCSQAKGKGVGEKPDTNDEAPDRKVEAFFDKTIVVNTIVESSDSPDTLDFDVVPELI